MKRWWLALAAVVVSQMALAQGFPDRPVKIIVPLPPGGSPDTIARMLAQHLQESWKQPVVVNNKGGAGGNRVLLR